MECCNDFLLVEIALLQLSAKDTDGTGDGALFRMRHLGKFSPWKLESGSLLVKYLM